MPVTLIHGNNRYLIDNHWLQIRESFLEDFGNEGLIVFDADEKDFQQLSAALFEQGLFSVESLILLKNLSKNKQFQDELFDVLDKVPQEAHLVIAEDGFDKRTGLYRKLNKEHTAYEYKELDEYSLVDWTLDEYRRMGGQIERSEARALINLVGLDQWALKNELEKLINHPQPVTREVIDTVVEPNLRDTVFNLLDAALAKDVNKTLGMYRKLVANREDPHKILSMIGWQLHILLLLAHAKGRSLDQIASEAKVSPFVLRKSQPALNKTTTAKLRLAAKHFVQTDETIKTKTSADAEVLIERLLLEIAS